MESASDSQEDHALRSAQGVPHNAERPVDADASATVAQPRPSRPNQETVRELRMQGSTLASLRQGRDYYRRLAELIIQAAQALEHAHESGVIHRDVKPANFLLDDDGELWITDFGLAQVHSDTRLTMTGDLVGTLRYMSPEQALAKRVIVDHRTDIYSLGATFYELLTLKPAFSGQDRQELLRQIAFEEPVAPRRLNRAIPVELETIVTKALEKNPADRYATAKEMAEDLKRFLNDEPTLARRPSLWQRVQKWSRRHVAAVRAAAAALLVVLVVLGGAAGWWFNEQANQKAETLRLRVEQERETERQRAEQERETERQRVEQAKETKRQRDSLEAKRLSQQAKTEQAVNGLLAETDQFQKERNVPKALAKAQQAVAILAAGAGTPVLQQRVQMRLADLQMAADLEEIRAQLAGESKGTSFDHSGADRKYFQKFRAYGIDAEALPWNLEAARIRERTVPVELAAALDHWSYIVKGTNPADQAKWKRLLAMARAVDADPVRNKVRTALEQGDGQALKALLTEVNVEELPAATVMALANALDKTGSSGDALQLLQQVQLRLSSDFWINFGLANYMHGRKPPDYDEAIRFSSAAVALRPESAAAFNNLGVGLEKKGRLNEAVAAYHKAIDINPKLHAAHNNLGNALARKNQLDDAIAAWWQAINIDPKPPEPYFNLGQALHANHQWEAAIDAYSMAIKILDEAIADRQAIEINPRFAPVYNNLAWLLATRADPKLRDTRAALTSANKAVELGPKDANHWGTLGTVYYRNGEWQKAIDALDKALELRKTGNSYNFFVLAMAHWQLDHKDQARTWYEKGVQWMEQHQPKDADLLRFRAEAAELLEIATPKLKGNN